MQINSSTFTPGCLVKIKNAIFFLQDSHLICHNFLY